jgi:hypothetical protein
VVDVESMRGCDGGDEKGEVEVLQSRVIIELIARMFGNDSKNSVHI